jgi:hypothetical protein
LTVKYSHTEYTDSCKRIEHAQQEVTRATEARDELIKKVRGYFRGLAKDFNYTLAVKKPDDDGQSIDPFDREGHGQGVLGLFLQDGTVAVTDDWDGELHKVLDRKGIPHVFEEEGGNIEMDIGIASERLEEALGEYRKRGARLPGQKGTWEGRTDQRSGRRRERG